MKYRKKPVVVEAIQYTGQNKEECEKFLGNEISNSFYIGFGVETLNGPVRIYIDDYLIKGIMGEYYPCDKKIFEKTYEKVED